MHVVYMVVVEVVVLCGVLVLLACCFAYWRMASPLSAGCLLTGKGRIGADIGNDIGIYIMSGYMCVESEGGRVGSFSFHVQLK